MSGDTTPVVISQGADSSTPILSQAGDTIQTEAPSQKIVPDEVFVKPLEVYGKEKGYPYTAEYFEVNKMWDIPAVKNKVTKIEKFIRSRFPNGTVEDCRVYLDNLVKMLRLPEDMSVFDKIDKVLYYLDIIDKQKKLEEQRRKFLERYYG